MLLVHIEQRQRFAVLFQRVGQTVGLHHQLRYAVICRCDFPRNAVSLHRQRPDGAVRIVHGLADFILQLPYLRQHRVPVLQRGAELVAVKQQLAHIALYIGHLCLDAVCRHQQISQVALRVLAPCVDTVHGGVDLRHHLAVLVDLRQNLVDVDVDVRVVLHQPVHNLLGRLEGNLLRVDGHLFAQHVDIF